MTALNIAQRERQQVLMKHFQTAIWEILPLADGYAFRLAEDAETILYAAEFMTIERLCCPFINFELEVGQKGRPVWLRLTGRAGVKEFIEAEFGVG
jgi:hypothetical protein